jgi:hypothetical protein
MVSKLQEVTAEVTSLRQYSPADAGVADAEIANMPRANNAVAGAAVIVKSCFIYALLFSLCECGRPSGRAAEMGCVRSARYACMAAALPNLLFVRVRFQSYVRCLP